MDFYFKDSWGDKELTGFVTLDGLKLNKVFKVGEKLDMDDTL